MNITQSPTFLYHGSATQNLKELDPNVAITSHDYFKSGKIVIPRVYAGNTKLIASAFTFQWNDDMGIKFGSWNGIWKFVISKEHYHLLKNKCSIYTVCGINFIKPAAGEGLSGEWYSNTKVRILQENKFDSCLEAMESQKLNIVVKGG